MKKILIVSIAILFNGALAGCGSSSAGPNAAEADAALAAAARGAQIYKDHCADCHGSDLSGGQAGSLLDDVWMHGSSDQAILRAIHDGIEDAGMPAFGEGLSKADQSDLLVYIRGGKNLETTPAIRNAPSVERDLKLEDWITGVDHPWAIAFTGPKDALITEKAGQLRVVRGGVLVDAPVAGIPEVVSNGQGGLLDVALDPEYSENGWIYLTFSHPVSPDASEAMTKVIRGKIIDNEWRNEETLFEAKPEHYVKARVHYGSRMTFDKQGLLYFSIGDRGQKEMAQDLTRPNGKIHRINRDGSIPTSNPFVSNPEAYPSIYAYGNRNPQGLIFHPETGVLWETEHGPKGGDELNVITKGVNYGWPEISYGRNYSGTELTPYEALPGMAQPASQWTPSIAVCGLDVYTGDLFPEWKGRLLAGALRNQTIRLIDVRGESYVSEQILIQDEGRVRDMTTGPDGAIYVALPNKILRISPR